jgi:hypothetical protein
MKRSRDHREHQCQRAEESDERCEQPFLNDVVVDLFRQRVELERRFGAHLLRNPLDRRDLMAYSRSISMTAESAPAAAAESGK